MNSLILGVIGSLVTAIIITLFNRLRKRQLEQAIQEIQEEEDLVVRLSKGNTRLIRLCFFMLFVFIASLLAVFIMFFLIKAFNLLSVKYLYIATAYLLFMLFIGSIYVAKIIIKSANVKDAKKVYKEKRDRIEKKLNR